MGEAIADLVGWALLRFLDDEDMGLAMPTLLYCGIDGRGDRLQSNPHPSQCDRDSVGVGEAIAC